MTVQYGTLSNYNSKLTLVEHNLVKVGKVCEFYCKFTSTASIPAWEQLVNILPIGFRPLVNGSNAYRLTVNNTLAMANFNGAGTLNTINAIPSGSTIVFNAIYISA